MFNQQLGSEIGRGGFGVVFAALDLRSARSVAIKQIALQDMDRDELASIESEISLLRKLHHENIVKYFDTIKTRTHLYIVLEYMENGSLAQFMKKFGSFSETLVAMYIAQVLRGLAYLHEQGVLHRDVKGANILTTKEGLVKLADFGVAVKLNETQKSNSVVGSPYWMAPEVIEMSGWSFASDIWSVGCTIIELLTTKPPYFDLSPMQAMFRIVQDDHPPLPERISPALHDFIMKCFMKEPRLRSSADDLLVHPWLTQIPRNKLEQSTQQVTETVPSSNDRDAMLNTIKMYTKGKRSDNARRPSPTGFDKQVAGTTAKNEEDSDEDENWDEELGFDDVEPKKLSLNKNIGNDQETSKSTGANSQEANRKSIFKLSKEDESALFDDDAWDDSVRPEKPITAAPLDDQRGWSGSAILPVEKRLSKLNAFREDEDDDLVGFEDIDETELLRAAASRRPSRQVGPLSPLANRRQSNLSAIERFMETDTENELTDQDQPGDMLSSVEEDLSHRLQRLQKSRQEHADRNDDDAETDRAFDDDFDFDYSSIRDNNQKATARVVELLTLLDPSMDDQIILDACSSLVSGSLIVRLLEGVFDSMQS
ncbi:hypothetical protein PINS_up010890 [Pythium insidiosum]|nr:hypothetical protein PINS_up010890 [Pythium insidiosum]